MRRKWDKKARILWSILQGFMAAEVHKIHRSETTRMATHMMENKNNKIKLQLSYKYQSLSYCLLSRSILGCFAISRLWGSPWWTFNLHVRFDQVSKYCLYFAFEWSPRRSDPPIIILFLEYESACSTTENIARAFEWKKLKIYLWTQVMNDGS